eukprot:TRINITY_DN72961_c0_g1_i1.p2 TRINITY_DN72961_c0_g1~~TRINITY_DN72961_c0_g1_i1.p2  ORF type:complete len:346 (+),score=130.14 TRINITY_DN72961_c0_g1_i1:49-1086(+)
MAMMKSVVLGLCLVAEVAAFRDLTGTEEARSQWSCGNCQYTTNIDGTNYRRCNTGGDKDKFPFSAYQQNVEGVVVPAALLEAHGTSTASATLVSNMKTLVEARTPNMWGTLFCASYLDMYKYEGDTTTGAACVRALSAEAIIETDNEAREAYNMFGTENGYPSSYAVANGDSPTAKETKYGTDGEGDVPSNWCGTYMRYLVCHAAFPQVLKTATNITDSQAASGGVDEARGTLRAIDGGSCSDMFSSCNRREPTSAEVKSSYVMPIVDNFRALTIEGSRGALERELDNPAFCEAWQKGYGLTQGGFGVSQRTDGDVADYLISFSSSSTLGASVVTLALAFVAMLL